MSGNRAAWVCRRDVLGLLAALSILLPCGAHGADQTEYLKKTPTVLEAPEKYINVSTGELPHQKAAALVRLAFPEEDVASPEFYCIIHVLAWADGEPSVDKSHWYIYRGRGGAASPTGRWTPARFEGTRIYGTDRLGLLYVHVNVPATTRAAAIAELEPQVARANAAGSTTTIANLMPAEGDPSTVVNSDRGNALRALGAYIVESRYTNIAYQMDIVKKLPAPIQNLQDALGLLQAGKPPEPFVTLNKSVGLYAADIFDIRHVPSDITVTGTLTIPTGLETKKTELGKQTYDNEGLYYWDISLGIPIRSLTQVNFETSGGQVFAKEVDKSQLLALANIFWRPIDTKNTRFLLVPSPIVGVALAKNPLEKVLVGLSIGLTRVQVYGARQWTQREKPPAPAAGVSTTASTTPEYEANWVVGINVPVRQVIDFLKSKK